jgi:hypothetical protein
MDHPILTRARGVLEAHWRPEHGWTVPNAHTYPHLWLWDSAFHSIAWARLGDERAVPELLAILRGQIADGLVPHMRYAPGGPDTYLGPLPDRSSITQPPMYGHAIATLTAAGIDVSDEVRERATTALRWLWEHRRDPETGLIVIVHPWEAGNDHSPRWDGWGAPGRTKADYVQTVRSGWNKELLHACELDADGAAIWSSRFVAAPAGFNAYVAWNMRELAAVTGDAGLLDRATELADVIDQQLWNDKAGLWDDRAVVGGDGESIRTPISDGVMPALVTASAERANRALENLSDPAVFGGCPYGPANVSQSDASYDPDAYWRGAAWPNMSYLLWIAATRRGLTELADAIAEQTRAGAVASGWAEYWNPHDGTGHGAAPQSWTSLVATMGDADA